MNFHVTTLLVCLPPLLASPAAHTQESPTRGAADITGEWEGAFEVDGAQLQSIVWRFARSRAGVLSGLMGPTEAGPVLRMIDVSLDGSVLKFGLEEQGSYVGEFTADAIHGTWTDTSGAEVETARLDMTRSEDSDATTRDLRGSDRMWLGTDQARSSSVATGDLDGDGDVDIVIGSGRHWPQANGVFFNSGAGRFPRSTALGIDLDTTYMVITVDIDGDQDLDILVGNEGLENVVYLNDGAGVFSVGSRFGRPDVAVRDLVVIDVNGDGKPDIAEFTRVGANTLYINDGRGKLDAAGTIGASSDSIGAAVAGDLNGNGLQDLVLVDRDGGKNSIYFAAEGGGFEDPVHFGRAGDETHDVALADMDGDGWLDIVSVSIGHPNQVHFGGPTHTFSDSAEFGGEARGYAVAVGDLDNDGDMDVVVGNQVGKNRAYFNRGDGRAFQKLAFGPDSNTYDVALADLNGDGFLDVAVANTDAHDQYFINAHHR